MSVNRLKELGALGQSLWLDYIRRDLFASGELRRLIGQDGVRGMTSNPAIFEKAIAESHIYDGEIQTLAAAGNGPETIYEKLTQSDVESAADEFRALYDSCDGGDGYVSLEVNPHLAHDARGTIAEGRRLWAALDRPNVLIKVPATEAGLLAIEQLLSEGINVNVTLLFGLPRYRQVTNAYINGVESRAAQGYAVNRLASVASFFVSRIDVLVDTLIEKLMAPECKEAELARKVHGQIAIASAKIAYQMFKEIFAAERFAQLVGSHGARPQRLLWASTSAKNPQDSDVKYVEALIGPETINTAPMETVNAYRDHGDPKARLEDHAKEARWLLDQLPELNIDLDRVTQQLEDEGVRKFCEPFDELMTSLSQRSPKPLRKVS